MKTAHEFVFDGSVIRPHVLIYVVLGKVGNNAPARLVGYFCTLALSLPFFVGTIFRFPQPDIHVSSAWRTFQYYQLSRRIEMHRHPNPGSSWGYAIYRTVYTEQSYQVWDDVIEKIESYLLHSLDKDYDAEELEEDYQSVIFDDPNKFDGVKIRRIRRHWYAMRGDEVDFYDPSHENDEEEEDSDDDKDEYEATKEEIKAFRANNTNFYCCILIDDEVLQSIMNAPSSPEEASKMFSEFKSIGYVKVVDQRPGPSDGDTYPGWMRVDLTCLWKIYGKDEIEHLYPYKDPKTGKRIVYNGCFPRDPEQKFLFNGVPLGG